MELLNLVATLLPLSMASGLNLYATVLIVGLSIRFNWVQNMPAGFEPLSSWVVIGAALTFFLMETLADKVPFIDNTWDIIHTIIRPLGAAMLGLMALGNVNPVVAILAAMAMGGVSLVSHGSKASARLLLNVISPLEGATNIAISSIEDVVASAMAFLALKLPYAAFALSLVIIILVIFFAPRIIRWGLFTLSLIFHRISCWFSHRNACDELPTSHQVLLDHVKPQWSVQCFIQNLPGIGGKKGYVSILPNQVVLTSSTWLKGGQIRKLPVEEIKAIYRNSKMLADDIEIYTTYGRSVKSPIRLIFTKDLSQLAEQLKEQMGLIRVPADQPESSQSSLIGL